MMIWNAFPSVEAAMIGSLKYDPYKATGPISKLRNIISAKAILLTMSNKGIFLNTRSGSKIKESTTSNVIDVSGAGDTVVSVAAMCLACKGAYDEPEPLKRA